MLSGMKNEWKKEGSSQEFRKNIEADEQQYK
jgi:hypothetical protein